MFKVRLKLRNKVKNSNYSRKFNRRVLATALACLVSVTMFVSCEKQKSDENDENQTGGGKGSDTAYSDPWPFIENLILTGQFHILEVITSYNDNGSVHNKEYREFKAVKGDFYLHTSWDYPNDYPNRPNREEQLYIKNGNSYTPYEYIGAYNSDYRYTVTHSSEQPSWKKIPLQLNTTDALAVCKGWLLSLYIFNQGLYKDWVLQPGSKTIAGRECIKFVLPGLPNAYFWIDKATGICLEYFVNYKTEGASLCTKFSMSGVTLPVPN